MLPRMRSAGGFVASLLAAPFVLLWLNLRDLGRAERTGQLRVFVIFALAVVATIVEATKSDLSHRLVAVAMLGIAIGDCFYARWLIKSGEDI